MSLNWSDERYVRLFTRDTPDWIMWPWQSRALLPLLMRKADRGGIIALGRHGARGLAALVLLPEDVTAEGLAGLIDDGCVELRGDALVIRNFIAAQEARATDAARARDYRDRKAAKDAAASPEQEPRHTASHGVTQSHAASQPVPPSLAVPSRADPILPTKNGAAVAAAPAVAVAPTPITAPLFASPPPASLTPPELPGLSCLLQAATHEPDPTPRLTAAALPGSANDALPDPAPTRTRKTRQRPAAALAAADPAREAEREAEQADGDRWIRRAHEVAGRPLQAKPWSGLSKTWQRFRDARREFGIDPLLRSLDGLAGDPFARQAGIPALLSESLIQKGLGAAEANASRLHPRPVLTAAATQATAPAVFIDSDGQPW